MIQSSSGILYISENEITQTTGNNTMTLAHLMGLKESRQKTVSPRRAYLCNAKNVQDCTFLVVQWLRIYPPMWAAQA